MKNAARWTRFFMAVLLLAVAVAGNGKAARANDLPLAAASPLSGVAFDDRPLLLPVQRNFQMAMLTASSELGRSCGRMEAYGWRMSQTEQGRVNQIFNNTVDRMRLLGYTITPQNLSSVSNDITLFTADRPEKHFIFLWSAGELGLVMTLCETTAPLNATPKVMPSLMPSVQVFNVPAPVDVVSSRLDAPGKNVSMAEVGGFTPLGEWVGGYTCAQGYTGGTLQINHLNGQNFEGVFKFYATAKNPNVAAGSYNVYGQYDRASHRILINPGKWIQRPFGYYDTVIVGSFDPVRSSFSGFFQGINGCTSIEAKRVGAAFADKGAKSKPAHKAKKVAHKKHKKHVSNVPMPVAASLLAPPVAPAPVAPPPAPVAAPAASTGGLAPITPASPPAAAPAAAQPAPVAAPVPAAPTPPAGIVLTAPGK